MKKHICDNGKEACKSVTAVILAAGKGLRMGTDVPKQFAEIGGRTVLSYTLEKFENHPEVDSIVVVCAKGSGKRVKDICAAHNITKLSSVVFGGSTRRESSLSGVRAVVKSAGSEGIVLIHDAARPLVSDNIISENIRLAREEGACVTAMPAVDTVVISRDGKDIDDIPPRETVWCVQTPQSFRTELILKAHEEYEKMLSGGKAVPDVTDDGSLVKLAGLKVAICPSGPENFKITVARDLELFKNTVV